MHPNPAIRPQTKHKAQAAKQPTHSAQRAAWCNSQQRWQQAASQPINKQPARAT